MNYLAIDTSAAHLTVLAVKGDNIALNYIPDCALKHSVTLMGKVDAAMDKVGLTPAECDFFCAVTGPGSFTGIRIGISTVKGFALAAEKPLMPLTAFSLIAYNVVKKTPFFAVIDAAHGNFYCQKFSCDGEPMGEAACVQGDIIAKEGLPLYGYEHLSLPRYTKIDAGNALKAAVERKAGSRNPFGDMVALYVRKSQAEISKGHQ